MNISAFLSAKITPYLTVSLQLHLKNIAGLQLQSLVLKNFVKQIDFELQKSTEFSASLTLLLGIEFYLVLRVTYVVRSFQWLQSI